MFRPESEFAEWRHHIRTGGVCWLVYEADLVPAA